MARGTFANIRLVNKFLAKPGPRTLHIPTGEELPIYDAAQRYLEAGQDTILVAGAMYGSGSSRDWAAKYAFASCLLFFVLFPCASPSRPANITATPPRYEILAVTVVRPVPLVVVVIVLQG
jgi:hypothetical protein